MASLIVAGDTSGTVTLQAPSVAGSTVLTLPTTSGTIVTTAGGSTVPFALGSASAPSITFSGDTNTGMFSPAADTIAFAEGGAEAMRIDSSGNVGIGTSSPTYRLQVASAGFPAIGFYRDLDVTVVGAAGQAIEIGARSGSTFTPAISITGVLDNPATTGALQFQTRTAGSLTEKMRIDSSGNLLVGCTSFPSTSVTGYKVSANIASGATTSSSGATTSAIAHYQFLNSNGTVGQIFTSGSSTTFATSSDYRLKENITPMKNALGVVQQLKPVTYKWKIDGSNGQGFIAHELQAVVPDCVVGEKDAVETVDDLDSEGKVIGTKEVPRYQGIDTSFLVATLTAAIQEQQALITQLQADVAELKGAA